jgi:hypothetical protein
MSAATCKVLQCSNKAAASVETAKALSASNDVTDAWRQQVAIVLDQAIAQIDAKILQITNPGAPPPGGYDV